MFTFVVTKYTLLRNWAKHIILLLIWSLSFTAGPAFAHTGVLAHKTATAAVYGKKTSTVIKQSDCCTEKTYTRYTHHINAKDCCTNHCMPVFGLPASITFKDFLCFSEPQKPAITFVSIYLSPGYSSVWLPPKIG